MTDAPRIPVFRVRFESFDDFLVEYGEHLRRGLLMLPDRSVVPVSGPIRIKLSLPDSAVLYLSGTIEEPGPLDTMAGGGARVRLASLTNEQRAALDACVARAAAPHEPAPTDSDEPAHLLLVDDSVSVRLELGDALRERGLKVRTAENGLTAIAAAIKRPPDVILSDVEMPTMDGWTLLRMVRTRKRLTHVPFVFHTRLDDDLSRLQGYRMGVDDFVPKGIAPDELLVRLRGVLARRKRPIRDAVAQGLRGDLSHVRLGSLLAFIEQERRTGRLFLQNSTEEAALEVLEGTIVRVDGLEHFQRADDRLFGLLDWDDGEFEFVPAQREEIVANEERPMSITYLLMEHARRADEAAAG